MPNMCHTRVSVTGPKSPLREFRNRCFVAANGGELAFSFDAIIPMPRAEQQRGSQVTLKEGLSFDRAKAAGVQRSVPLTACFQPNAPGNLTSTRQCADAVVNWRNAHWGTKWTASHTEILSEGEDNLEIRFATPWRFPWPVFMELGHLFPALHFKIVALDPDTGEGFRGHVGGSETSANPINPAEVDDVVRWLFQPQVSPAGDQSGKPSFYSLIATRQFFIVRDLETQAGTRVDMRNCPEEDGCLILVDDAQDDGRVVASLDSVGGEIDEAEILARFRDRIIDHLVSGNARQEENVDTLALEEPRFFSVFRLPAGDYCDRNRAYFKERGERLFTIGTM